MYCVLCGVKLADTEKKCPLCDTIVSHPDIKQDMTQPLYPSCQLPKRKTATKVLGGAGIILYLIPLIICFFSDLQANGTLDWFGYVLGALLVAYITFALPFWFQNPNPVIFTPCSIVATILYLLYINLKTNGHWFLSFVFPISGALGLVVCTVITLVYYLRRGRLYIFGGAAMALGGIIFLLEYLLVATFHLRFTGWSVYPLVVLVLLGSLLIYLAISNTAREILERKLFF